MENIILLCLLVGFVYVTGYRRGKNNIKTIVRPEPKDNPPTRRPFIHEYQPDEDLLGENPPGKPPKKP